MNTLVVLVAIVAVVAAAPQNVEDNKVFSFKSTIPSTTGIRGYYPGQQGIYPVQQSYYPGYQGFQGYYPGFQGFQGYYPGYQGYNRGYYQAAPVVSSTPSVTVFSAPAVTPAPVIATAPVAPKIFAAPAASPAPAPAPVYNTVYKNVDTKVPIAIVRQSQEVNFDGNFRYGYETENGIVAQAAGYVKNAGSENAAQVIEGSYSYTADDGTPVEVKYYADETGYHASGNVVPTTPPEIARSLELIASQPQKPEDSKKK